MSEMNKIIVLVLLVGLGVWIAFKPPRKTNREAEALAQRTIQPVEVTSDDGFQRAYFASGCFWCVEAIYESVRGVEEVISGYSGGHTQKPTYRSIGTGTTGHTETVEVIYDDNQVSFEELLDVYFDSQNVTQAYGQGNDRGSQYRSVVFYQNTQQKTLIDAKIAAVNATLKRGEVAAEVLPFQKFWIAEKYHQDYEKFNPTDPYVRGVSIPRLRRFQKKRPNLLKSSPE